jgi:hypothetical protein
MQNIKSKISEHISIVPPLYDNFRVHIINENGKKCCVDVLNIVSREIYNRNELGFGIGFSRSIKVNIHKCKILKVN